MDMKQRLDPELVQPLDNLMAATGGGFNLHDLAATRAMVDAMVASVKAQVPPIGGVVTEDVKVPGGAGAPAVAVRIYRPAGRTDALPVLVWMHGGGWMLGGIELDDLMARQLAKDVRCAVVSVEYRLAPEHPYPAALEDCYAVVEWLAGSGALRGLDRQRIAVGGGSAGGNLAAGLALLARDRGKVDLHFQLLIYPAVNDRNVAQVSEGVAENLFWSRENTLLSWRAYLANGQGRADVPIYAAPARARDLAGLPPAYIAIGGIDMFLADNLDYAERLTAAGVSTELHVYPGAFHAFDAFAPMARVAQQFVNDRNAALQRALSTIGERHEKRHCCLSAPSASRRLPTATPRMATSMVGSRAVVEDCTASLFAWVPRALGGAELDPISSLEVIENLAYGDPSAGWVLMAAALADGTGAAYLGDSAVAELFHGERMPVIAGQGTRPGTAVPHKGGFLLSGSWSFASGIKHGTHIHTLGVIQGTNEPRIFVLPVEQATLIDNWDVMGLRGTGSIDYKIESVFVPEDYTHFAITETPKRGGALYTIGIIGFAGMCHSGWACGIGRRLLDELAGMVRSRGGSAGPQGGSVSFQEDFAKAEATYRAARAFVHEAWRDVRDTLDRGAKLSVRQHTLIRLAMANITWSAHEVALFVYKAGGTAALRASTIQRLFRDMHAGTQHLVASPPVYQAAGRELAGLADGESWVFLNLVKAAKG
jgi:acetyl esterase/lipase/alkylation response protein AidB-like acyl-CoA dehydrogenase